jgi:hypothetical protein
MGMLSVHTSPSLLCLAFDLPTPAGLSHLTASALFLHLSVRAPRFGVGAGGGVCRCGRREEFWFVLCCAVLCQGRRRAFLSLFFYMPNYPGHGWCTVLNTTSTKLVLGFSATNQHYFSLAN